MTTERTSVADSFYNVACTNEAQGKYEEALEMHTKSLEIKTRICGDNHPSVGASLNNMANVYETQGKYEKALEMHTKSLDIKTCILGGGTRM